MKRAGILNSDISRVLSYMGHTDCICIGDCGLPIPNEVERIDLTNQCLMLCNDTQVPLSAIFCVQILQKTEPEE